MIKSKNNRGKQIFKEDIYIMSRITRRILTGVLASVAVVTGMMTISIAIAMIA